MIIETSIKIFDIFKIILTFVWILIKTDIYTKITEIRRTLIIYIIITWKTLKIYILNIFNPKIYKFIRFL